jgi:hypothetical protein
MGFELRAFHWQSRRSITQATSSAHFAQGILEKRVYQTICPGWPQIAILLISASQAARIIGVSHQHLAINRFYNFLVSLLILIMLWGRQAESPRGQPSQPSGWAV